MSKELWREIKDNKATYACDQRIRLSYDDMFWFQKLNLSSDKTVGRVQIFAGFVVVIEQLLALLNIPLCKQQHSGLSIYLTPDGLHILYFLFAAHNWIVYSIKKSSHVRMCLRHNIQRG